MQNRDEDVRDQFTCSRCDRSNRVEIEELILNVIQKRVAMEAMVKKILDLEKMVKPLWTENRMLSYMYEELMKQSDVARNHLPETITLIDSLLDERIASAVVVVETIYK